MIDNPFNLQESPSPNSFDFEKRLSSLEALIGIVYTPIGEGHAISSKMSKNIMKHIKHERNNNADTFRLLKIYSENLEERVHQLEQSLKSDRKNTQRIDRKLRHRIQMLESQVDMMENGYFWETKEKQKDKDRPFKPSPCGNYKVAFPIIKIAIRVENQQEFELLKGILFSQGKRGLHFTQYQERFNLIEYEAYNGSINRYFNEHYIKSSTYYIIPFNILKTILGA